MKIKAIVLDMDGTLLTIDKGILPETKNKLISLQKQGIKLILASGRPTRGIEPYAKELKMDQYEGMIISFNGAKAIDFKTNEVIFNQTLSLVDTKAILEHAKNFNVIPMIDNNEYLVVNNVYNNNINWNNQSLNVIEHEGRGANYLLKESKDLAQFVDYELNKILLAGDPEYLKENYQAINAPFKDKVNAMFTADFYYEFTAKGIDKAKSLALVLEKLKIKPEETIAFGDGENDLPIIRFAGIGVAMGNAMSHVKTEADFVTLSNEENGIVVGLEKFL